MAVTGTAQSVISSTKTFFESFLVDNYKFIDINEAFHYMNMVCNQDYKLPKYIVHETKDNLYDRIINMFYQDIFDDKYEEPIRLYIEHLTQEEIDKIYYKNNMIEFIRRHDKIADKFSDLFASVNNYDRASTIDEVPLSYLKKCDNTLSEKDIVKKYNSFVNHEMFIDPNNPPENIKDQLDELKKLIMDCVYMPFMSVDRIHRLKYFRRRTVCIVDTDSNILAVDLLVDFFRDEVMRGETYGRDADANMFIIVNTLAYFITGAVADTLFEYGKYSNIPEEHRFRFGMKNEFFLDL